MEFIKKHYEKMLLGLVLAGLIGALVFMLFYIAADKQAMDERGTDDGYAKTLHDNARQGCKKRAQRE